MQLFTRKEDFQNYRNKSSLGVIGLVPTMGNLHQGHLNLVKESLKETDHTIVTIFVNPKQFGPGEDFEKYPRTLESDLKKLKDLSGSEKILVFSPESVEDIFPTNFSTDITVTGLDQALCGLHRPGHFKGVTTVVYQLFTISKAHKAYFGQKDFQQFKIIEKMTKDLNLPIELSMVPIARESTGLALSSRNQYMSTEQKLEAAQIYKSLRNVAQTYLKDGQAAETLKQDILFKDPSWQYLEVLDSTTLKAPTSETKQVVVAGAYHMGDTRLIDNILVNL